MGEATYHDADGTERSGRAGMPLPELPYTAAVYPPIPEPAP